MISFRSLELPSRKVCQLVQVYEFVQLAELYYAGSHGMDIMGPANGTNGFKAKGTQMKDKMVHIFPAVLFVFPGWTSVTRLYPCNEGEGRYSGHWWLT